MQLLHLVVLLRVLLAWPAPAIVAPLEPAPALQQADWFDGISPEKVWDQLSDGADVLLASPDRGTFAAYFVPKAWTFLAGGEILLGRVPLVLGVDLSVRMLHGCRSIRGPPRS